MGTELSGHCSLGELPGELLVVLAHLAGLHRIFEDDQSAVERERLFEEVVGAQFGGAHGCFDGAVASDDDDLGNVRRLQLANLCESVETIAVGQPDVEQNDVVRRSRSSSSASAAVAAVVTR